MKKVLCCIVSFLFVFSIWTVTYAKEPGLQNSETAYTLSSPESEVIRLVNIERSKVGAKPLKYNLQVSKVARYKAQDMINKNYFSHYSPTYGSPFDMLRRFGISFSAAGENIASGQRTPQAVVRSWMNSPGHRRNILNPRYTDIGVGMAKSSSGKIDWVQMFISK